MLVFGLWSFYFNRWRYSHTNLLLISRSLCWVTHLFSIFSVSFSLSLPFAQLCLMLPYIHEHSFHMPFLGKFKLLTYFFLFNFVVSSFAFIVSRDRSRLSAIEWVSEIFLILLYSALFLSSFCLFVLFTLHCVFVQQLVVVVALFSLFISPIRFILINP